MSRRRPGEHEPGHMHFTFPLSNGWLVGGGLFALACLPAGAVVFSLTNPHKVRMDSPTNWIILGVMFTPLLTMGLLVLYALFRLCFLSGPTRHPVANPSRTDHLLNANDRRRRWQSRSFFLSVFFLGIMALVLGSPRYSGQPMDAFLWTLVAVMFTPLVIHAVVYAVLWRPYNPSATCYDCGAWFFDQQLQEIAETGRCPDCGYRNPLKKEAATAAFQP